MKLKEYLKRNRKSRLAFSKENGINQKAIDRIVREAGGITLRTAKKVVRATAGEVTIWDLPSGKDDKIG